MSNSKKTILMIESIKNLYLVPNKIKNKASFPFKICFKLVTDLFVHKLELEDRNPEEIHVNIIEHLIPYFSKVFGMVSLAQKKLKMFFAALFAYRNSPRIEIFMRLI